MHRVVTTRVEGVAAGDAAVAFPESDGEREAAQTVCMSMAWGVGGWLLPPFLKRVGPEAAQELRERVAREIKTTFASRYTREVSLAEALQLKTILVYGRQATGEKILVNPNKGT